MPDIIITMPERERSLEDLGFDRSNPRFKRAFERRSENDYATENRPLNTRDNEDMGDYDKAVADSEKDRLLKEMDAALADAEKRRTVKDSKPK